MIHYYPDKLLVVMTLEDLERCGFAWPRYVDLLARDRIDDRAARWPIALMCTHPLGCVAYDPQRQVIHVGTASLKRCGFDAEQFGAELQQAAEGQVSPGHPFLNLIVNFAGGATISLGISPETLNRMEEAHLAFLRFIAPLGLRSL